MTLLDTIKSNAATTRAEAVVCYRTLLARNDRPKPGDEREMTEVMRTLGLSAEDVADDCRALAQAAELRRQILSPADLEAKTRQHGEAMEAARKELIRLMHGLIDKLDFNHAVRVFDVLNVACPNGYSTDTAAKVCQPMYAAEMNASAARQQNVDLQQRLDRLTAAHPRAFSERPSQPQSAVQVHYGSGPTPPTFAPGHPGNVRTVDASTGVARGVARRSR